MTIAEPAPAGAALNIAAAAEIGPAVWVGWPGGPALPPWIDRFDDPTFDECWEADRLQDLAQAVAERFGPPEALACEREYRPRPAPLPAGPARLVELVDDEVSIARRRRILERALQPAPDAPPAPRRRRRVA
jgi:hypothetical protein